jgi:uncharacterized protein YabE (DUF348 family)
MPVTVKITNNETPLSSARVAVSMVAISDPSSDGAKRVLQPGESGDFEVPSGAFLVVDEDTKEF